MSSVDDEIVPPGRGPSRRAFMRTTARTAAGVLVGGALVRTFATEPPSATAAGVAPSRTPVHALSHAGLSAQLGKRFMVSGSTGAGVPLRLVRIGDVVPSVTRASHLGVPLGGEQFSPSSAARVIDCWARRSTISIRTPERPLPFRCSSHRRPATATDSAISPA